MEISELKLQCTGCHACYNACPVDAISMMSDEEGFLYPKIIDDRCIHCNRCNQVCPVINSQKTNPVISTYGAYQLDLKERMKSSSGGVFAELAKEILKMNGSVFGAAFDEQLEVKHIEVNNQDDLDKVRGTKYVQSKIGNTLRQVRSNLDDNHMVLFSGTPCQIAGLKAYLGHDYDNLLCVDLICHGVPSPQVFSRYLSELSQEKTIHMTFRNKEKGIHNAILEYKFADGSIKTEKYGESLYIYGFINNLFNRPSCYQCNYKGHNRSSDITLGDFWGIESVAPDFSNDFGISAVLVHTQKGKEWLSKIQPKLSVISTTIENVESSNVHLNKSIYLEPTRPLFFKYLKKRNVHEAVIKVQKRNGGYRSFLRGILAKMK